MLKLRQPCYGTGDGFGGGGFGTNDSNASDVGGGGLAGGDLGSNSAHGGIGGLNSSDYKSRTDDDIKGLQISYNPDGTIDARYGGIFGGVMSSAPNGQRNEGGFLDAWGYDMGFRSSFAESFDKEGNYSKNFDPVGAFNATVSVTVGINDGYGTKTFTGGTIAGLAMDAGLTGKQAITAEAVAQVAVSALLGAPVGMIAPLAKAAHVQGFIDADTAKALQAAGALASFAQGMLNGVQALDAINTAKNYGAINDLEAGLMAAATIADMAIGVKGFSAHMESLGFGGVSTTDMHDFGVSSDGDRTYINGKEVTLDNLQSYMNPFALYIANRNKADSLKDDIFGRMAGSYFYNDLAAGGSLFSAIIPQTTNLIASVGKDIQYPMFAQMSILQEDFLGISRNAYRATAKA